MLNQGLIVRCAILALIQLCSVKSQEPITCTAGYYRAGETAKITCHYHGDIATTRNSGAYIQRHKLDARDFSSGMEVTVCHFSGGSVSVCDPEAGYRFVSFSPRNLTIDVPHVSAEFQGRYTCGLVPPPGESPSRTVHPCLLVVEDTSTPDNKVQRNPGVHEGLHGHVQAVLALLIIVIIVAVAVIAYTVVAYNKTWFPFRKDGKPKKQDAEKGDEKDSASTRLIVQEKTNPIFSTQLSASAPPVEPEKVPLMKGDNDGAPRSVSRDEVGVKRDTAVEKLETEDERRERENREKAEKAAEEIGEEERNLICLKQNLTCAEATEKKYLEKEKKKSEERLKQLKKAEEERKKQLNKAEEERKKQLKKHEEERKKQLKKDEEERKKREEKERKEREKAEKKK